MSQDIFLKDPFLLKGDSQAAFGQSLLKNILIRRTAMSSTANLVDLYGAKDRGARPLTKRPPDIPDDVAQRYLRSRIERRDLLSEAEREELMRATMVSSGGKTERRLRNSTVKSSDGMTNVRVPRLPLDCEARAALAAKAVNINHRLRIATVGVRVKVSRSPEPTKLNEDLCFVRGMPRPKPLSALPDKALVPEIGQTARAKDVSQQKRWKKWVDTVCAHIDTAVERDSQIVVLPEFGLPPDAGKQDLESRIRNRLKTTLARKQSAHFVFAGTRHDAGVNRGLILHLQNGKEPHPPEWHYKIASARTLGENIVGPPSDSYATYEVEVEADQRPFKTHVTVAICIDAFDPSTFLSLVLSAARRNYLGVPQVILVPSFNPSDYFVDLLRDLSFMTGSIVIYVNSLHGDARGFIAGFSVGDLMDESAVRLLAQIEAHHEALNAKLEAVLTTLRRAIGKDEKVAREQTKLRDRLRAQLSVVKTFQIRVKDLVETHGLEHLITVERCESCEKGEHTDDYGCRTDVLYYNIDVRLIVTLLDWRSSYFNLDESFLPPPFRQKELEEEAERQAESQQKRARREGFG